MRLRFTVPIHNARAYNAQAKAEDMDFDQWARSILDAYLDSIGFDWDSDTTTNRDGSDELPDPGY